MPQLFRIGPYLVYFWSNENNPVEPVHVHIAEGRPSPKCHESVDYRKREGSSLQESFQDSSKNFGYAFKN